MTTNTPTDAKANSSETCISFTQGRPCANLPCCYEHPAHLKGTDRDIRSKATEKVKADGFTSTASLENSRVASDHGLIKANKPSAPNVQGTSKSASTTATPHPQKGNSRRTKSASTTLLASSDDGNAKNTFRGPTPVQPPSVVLWGPSRRSPQKTAKTLDRWPTLEKANTAVYTCQPLRGENIKPTESAWQRALKFDKERNRSSAPSASNIQHLARAPPSWDKFNYNGERSTSVYRGARESCNQPVSPLSHATLRQAAPLTTRPAPEARCKVVAGTQLLFTLFPELPTELRLKIWEFACLHPRKATLRLCRISENVLNKFENSTQTETLADDSKRGRKAKGRRVNNKKSNGKGDELLGYRFISESIQPPVLHACVESREVAQGIYTLAFGTSYAPASTYFNYQCDDMVLNTRDERELVPFIAQLDPMALGSVQSLSIRYRDWKKLYNDDFGKAVTKFESLQKLIIMVGDEDNLDYALDVLELKHRIRKALKENDSATESRIDSIRIKVPARIAGLEKLVERGRAASYGKVVEFLPPPASVWP